MCYTVVVGQTLRQLTSFFTRAGRAWFCAGVLLLPAMSLHAQEAELEEQSVTPSTDPTQESPHWVDTSHAFATNRAQALAQWMDDFFGAPVRDAERADTFVRLIGVDDWESRDGHDLKLRVRGQVSLPKLSERVDLIFSGEENEQGLTETERAQENDVGVRFNFRDSERFRFDATLSARSGPALLPGVRFRYQQPITDDSWGRVTQRLQWHSEDGYRALTNIDLNRFLDDRSLLRWGARMRWEEDKGFWDWTSSLVYRQWLRDHERFPSAVEYFVNLSGRDDPEPFNANYRVGMTYRKSFFREYLFYEVEPSFNWRKETYESGRKGILGIVLRLEIMLDDDLISRRKRERS